jgi:Fe2+ or Zn2+ uptake regulation protein
MKAIRYGKDADDYILDLTVSPRTTYAILKAARVKFPKMTHSTVKRKLLKLEKAGKVTIIRAGKMEIWSLSMTKNI